MQHIILGIIVKIIGGYINLLSYVSPKKATALAYHFFSAPRAGRLTKNALPQILRQATAKMVTHKGHLFQMYIWQGKPETETILLVHGWESNASRWELLIDYFKKSGCTFIALDAPAHGLSEGTEFNIPLYADFVDCIVKEYKPGVLIGHSLGGATALYYAATYMPKAITKMVIMGAPSELTTILKNYTNNLGLNSNVYRLMKKHIEKKYKMNVNDFSGSKFAAAIAIKSLVAHDREDDTVPYSEGKNIAAALPGATFITTKGMGHSMHDNGLYEKIYNFIFEGTAN